MRILVAVDGSDCSRKALEHISARPWNEDDQFLVLSVVEPIPPEVGLGYVPGPAIDLEGEFFQECAEISGKAGARLARALPTNPVEARVESGPVVDTIVQIAEDWKADLIILGSHGRRGLSRLFLGSVSEQVMQRSKCSVEVIKAKVKKAA